MVWDRIESRNKNYKNTKNKVKFSGVVSTRYFKTEPAITCGDVNIPSDTGELLNINILENETIQNRELLEALNKNEYFLS